MSKSFVFIDDFSKEEIYMKYSNWQISLRMT